MLQPRPPSAKWCDAGHLAVRSTPPRMVAARAEVTIEKPLTKDKLVEYISSGCKPKSKWRIGTEHEKIVFRQDLRRARYADIETLLQKLVQRFNWEPIMEGDKIIGCKKDGQSVTLEPGGQFELSGAPLANLHQTCDEVNSHLYQIKTISEEMGLGFMGVGFDPLSKHEDVPMMPKGRYGIMTKYLPTVGSLGLDMMYRSCTIQVNLDYGSEQDMVEKFRIGLALQPLTTALFASSPFKEGKPTGYQSWRGHVWTDVDNARSGTLPFVFSEDFGFEKYVDWVLDVPMLFAYRNGEYIDASGQSFRDFIDGKLPALPDIKNGIVGTSPHPPAFVAAIDYGVEAAERVHGNRGKREMHLIIPMDSDHQCLFACTEIQSNSCQWLALGAWSDGDHATMDDWEAHLTTVFPDVRMKKFLEMRGADGGPWNMICAMSALWVGLVYDSAAQKATLDLISDWTVEDIIYLRETVPVQGLRTPFRDGTLLDVAKCVLKISEGGLDRRGNDEVKFLRRLNEMIENDENQAEQLLRLYATDWQQSVEPAYKHMAF